MGNCCSNPSTRPPSPLSAPLPQQPQSGGQTSEPRRDMSYPVSPQGCDTMLEPNPVQPGESILVSTPSQSYGKTSQKAPPSSGRSRASSSPHYSTKPNSPYPSHDKVPPVPGGEMSQKPLPTPGRSRFLSSPDHVSKPNSAYPSYDSVRAGPSLAPGAVSSSSLGRVHSHGHKHRYRIDSAPDTRSTRRATLKSATARGNHTGSLPSTMREVLPDRFRFRILVLGKSQSGKSSLINAVFNVDMAVGPFLPHPVSLIEYFY